MAVDADGVTGQQGAAALPSAAAAAAAQPSAWQQHHASSVSGPPAAFLEAQQSMQAALQSGNFAEVLRLLGESEEAAAAAAGGGTAWRPRDRAALYDLALRACAQHGEADQARRLLSSMRKQQVPVGVMANSALLQALCAVGRHAAALQHLQAIPSRHQRTPMYTRLLRYCVDKGALVEARKCWELFQRLGHTPDARLLAEVVRLHGACGYAAAAEAAWQAALPTATCDADAAALHAARAAALANAGSLEAAVEALTGMMDAFASLLPVDTSRSLREAAEAEAEAGAAARDGGAAAAEQQHAQQARQARRPAGPVEFMQQARNAVLGAAQARGDSATAQRVASLATLRGLPPDVGTYNSLLRATTDRGDGMQAVLDGVQEMRRLGLRPNRETYLLVLRACAAEADTAAAQAVFDALPAEGEPQARPLHQALLRVYSAAGDLEGADQAYRRMQAAGFPPDGTTFAALLDTVQQWARHDAAHRAASDEPSGVASIERTHQRQLAAALLERWSADLDAARPSVLNPALFASLLKAYSQSGQVHTVLLLMWQAFGCQLSPDTAAALGISSSGGGSSSSSGGGSGGAHGSAAAAPGGSSALDALDAALEEDSGRQTVAETPSGSSSGMEGSSGGGGGGGESSSSSGGESSSSSSSSSGDSLSGEGDMEARMLSPLRQSTIERAQLAPSLPIFNAAIGACTRVGHAHMRDAVALLRCMLVAGLSPNVATYTSLITGCAYGRQAALARELLRHMQQREVQPSAWTHNAMLKVECWTYGVDAGLALLRRLVGQGFRSDRATWSTLLASAKHYKRSDIADLALAELAAFQQREDAAAKAARRAEEAAAAEAAAAGRPLPAGDHRWHGYYEQQEDEDDW